MSDALKSFSTRRTTQTERADARQVENSAGGYSFAVDDLARLRRFLVLGTDGGSYYAGQHELTTQNAELVVRLAAERPTELLDEVVRVSVAGRAPKNDQALFALAIAAASPDDSCRARALASLPLVARTGTHLFQFAGYLEQFRGWGRGARKALSRWYLDKEVSRAEYQVVKYRQREGWTHRDVLRLAHPFGKDSTDVLAEPSKREAYRSLFDWVSGRDADLSGLPLVAAFEEAKTATPERVLELIEAQPLSWEMLRDDLVTRPDVWETLVNCGRVPTGALLRQLPRLTRLGLLQPLASRNVLEDVVRRLTSADELKKARLHPLTVLTAHATYAAGSGRGGTWNPVGQVVDALDAGFYAAFGAVQPTGKRLMLSLDVSGSMSWGAVAGSPLTPRDASAALALVTANVETSYAVYGFSHRLTPLAISPKQRLRDAVRTVSDLPFGGTDCALPMKHALAEKLEVDTFVVYTDSETWAGRNHPHQALAEYRQKVNPAARLVVNGMVSNGFTIADPADAGMLDVVGFDAATPELIGAFARGEV